jgi:hypothetical protein
MLAKHMIWRILERWRTSIVYKLPNTTLVARVHTYEAIATVSFNGRVEQCSIDSINEAAIRLLNAEINKLQNLIMELQR